MRSKNDVRVAELRARVAELEKAQELTPATIVPFTLGSPTTIAALLTKLKASPYFN